MTPQSLQSKPKHTRPPPNRFNVLCKCCAKQKTQAPNDANDDRAGDSSDVQLLKEWNIDRFFSRDDEKRHSTQSAIGPSTSSKELAAGRLERQVHREIISPKAKAQITPAAAVKGGVVEKEKAPSQLTEGNFMKNFSFIKNFKREKSDLFPLSKRHSSEISYNVNAQKYISAGPQRSSVMECGASKKGDTGGVSLLRAGPRREKTESVILRRNSAQVMAKQAEEARVRAMNSRPVTATETRASINNQIDLKSSVGTGEGGCSRFYGDQVILNVVCGDSVWTGLVV